MLISWIYWYTNLAHIHKKITIANSFSAKLKNPQIYMSKSKSFFEMPDNFCQRISMSLQDKGC